MLAGAGALRHVLGSAYPPAPLVSAEYLPRASVSAVRGLRACHTNALGEAALLLSLSALERAFANSALRDALRKGGFSGLYQERF